MIYPVSQISFKTYNDYSKNNQLFSPFVRSTHSRQPIQVAEKSNSISFGNKLFAASFLALLGVAGFVYGKRLKATPDALYRKELAVGLSKILGMKVKSKNLSSIMGKEELLKVLSELKAENYQASAANIKNGIFIADLHSHSIFSDGAGSVEDILSKVAEYANNLNRINGKKFIFALTDHNEIGGLKHALQIISKNPDKFKNVRFVPGMEVSYALKVTNSNNPFEVAEVLAYGVNPFSETINAFVKNIHSKRKNMISNFISDLKSAYPEVSFSVNEMAKFYPANKTCLMNLQWQVHHYAQTKIGVTEMAKIQNLPADVLYQQIMARCTSRSKTLYALKQENLIPEYIADKFDITKLAKEKYSPNFSNGIINAPAENTFDEIINTFAKEKSSFLAFAHPVYITKCMKDINETKQLLQELTKKSNGLIKASESYHQAYKSNIVSQHDIDAIKAHTDQMGLFNLGGHDSHSAEWIVP